MDVWLQNLWTYTALEKQKGEFQIQLFWGFSPAEVGAS